MLPRRSFERWVEERRGHSAPWSPWQAFRARLEAEASPEDEPAVLRSAERTFDHLRFWLAA